MATEIVRENVVSSIPPSHKPGTPPAAAVSHATFAVEKAACLAGHPIYFGPTRELFGFWYATVPAKRAGTIVLAPPVGWDFEATYRTYGRLAERLYLEGFNVLRFHYHGTGDSSGTDYDPERVPAWQGSLKDAIAEAKRRSGSSKVSLFGVRMGGLLAGLVAPEVGGIESMVLWAPCVTGKAYVREIGIMRALNPDESAVGKGEKVAGGEEAGGFMLSASTVAALKGVNLTKIAPGAPQYLVLGRDDLPGGDAAFVKHLADAGANVKFLEPAGYKAMMVDPLESVVPEAALDTVVSFFAEVHPVHVHDGPDNPPPSMPSPPSAASEVRLDLKSSLVREQAVRFGGDMQLFGIVTEPPLAGEKPAGHRTGIVYLNTGANPHMGPHRIYVPLARSLAARGIVSLRIDIEGFADSPPREGVKRYDSYSSTTMTNARAAIDYLRSERGVDKVLFCGMCSGAYHTFHTALADERVKGAIMLRPQVFSWEKGEEIDRDRYNRYRDFIHYFSRAFELDAWAKAFRGDVQYDRAFNAIVARAKVFVTEQKERVLARLNGQNPSETKLYARFKTILGRGCETMLVYSRNDPGLDHLNVQVGPHIDDLKAKKGFNLVLMEGKDFTFAATWSQDQLLQVVENFIVERFG